MENKNFNVNDSKKNDGKFDFGNKTYLIGDDGISYATLEAMEQANNAYWDKFNNSLLSGVRDLSQLRALDGSYHSNPESIKEANRRYRERLAQAIEVGDVSVLNEIAKKELLAKLFANSNYALTCAGLDFIKQVYQIDPKLAKDIVNLILEATLTGNFENTNDKFMKLIATQINLQDSNEKLR